MTIIDPARDLEDLRSLCGGAVALPSDDGYDAARQAFNLAVDQRPAAVVYPCNAQEVAAVVGFARSRGLRVAPQSTGHNAGPLGGLERTILLKTSGMHAVTIDAERRIARAEAGVLWEDVVDAASAHGLYALHGSSPDVGVVGYSLGGGMGWLARSHGFQTNNLTAIELVTADGTLVRTDRENDPELFWALRGGGGNFGVVTAIEFKLFPIAQVYAGFMMWDWTHAERVLTAWAEWALDAPDEVTTSIRILQLPPLPDLPEFLRGRQIVMIDGAVQGDDHAAILAPLRALEPELDTFATVPAASLVRLHQDPEEPMPFTSESALIAELTPAAIRAFVMLAGPGSNSPLLMAELRQGGGALARVTPGHGALAKLDAPFILFAGGLAIDADMEAAVLAQAGHLKAALEPWTAPGQYLNFAEHQVDTSESYGAFTYRRLQAVKARVDPDNLIHANHSL
jgi:FAD binding domain/Berberine and berberine like